MSASVKVKPPYIGLLNAISTGETRGGQLFEAWAGSTKNPRLRECLSVVAKREYDHGELFCARLAELGFELKPAPPSAAFEAQLAVLRSDASDREKLAAFRGPQRPRSEQAEPAPRPAPPQLDPVTKALYDWYLLEEKDSGRILGEAFAEISREGGKKAKKGKGSAPAADEDECVTLFKAIAAGERVGGLVLAAWAGATKDPELRETLALVASRESEHARVFRGRVNELGLEVEEKSGKKLDKVVAFYADPKIPDCEKAERAAPSVQGDGSGLDKLVASAQRFGTIERHLIQWFADEERDSTARLQACYAATMAKAS